MTACRIQQTLWRDLVDSHANTVPARFRSKPFTSPSGEHFMVATIDDVVRWSMTGKGAKGSWEDEPKETHISCNSGFCE